MTHLCGLPCEADPNGSFFCLLILLLSSIIIRELINWRLNMNIDLNDPDIMDSKDASRIWGHADNYVRLFIKQNPGKFPNGSIRKFGQTWVVTTRGMEAITGVKDPRKGKSNGKK